VIVNDLDLVRIAILPTEADSPLVIDADAVLARAITAELLEAIPRRHPEILQLLGGINHDQLPEHHPDQFGGKAADTLTPEQSLGIRIGEALDHPKP
jgi:hypothetical protein